MATTDLVSVADQIQKFWSPNMTKQLRSDNLLASMVNKEYSGEIKQGGDTVYVSQVDAPTGEIRTVGVDADSFESEELVTHRIAVTADKRIVASHEFDDLVDLQSQIKREDSQIRAGLMYALETQLNNYLYSLVAPSASAPDHDISASGTFSASVLASVRTLASQAKWRRDKPWYLLASPQFYTDMLVDPTLASSDFGANGAPTIGGNMGGQRYGFNIFEDNSRTGDYGLAFHPDFLHLVMQQALRFKVSDQHANKRFKYVISADILVGAKLGIAGDEKHIRIT